MASKVSNKSITQVFGSVAAAQTMVEQFPFSFGVSESGFTCSFDLLTALFNMCSDKPLDEMIIEEISDKLSDPNSTWLQGIEETVKMVLEANLTSILTCEMSPIIPDRLIGGAQFLSDSTKSINFSGEGVTIPLSSLDFTGVLGNCPTDDSVAARSNYMSCHTNVYSYSRIEDGAVPEDVTPILQDTVPTENVGDYIVVDGRNYMWKEIPLSTKDLWKHDDFNAFLWFVKNKGVYANLSERNKLMWDNRYKTRPYTKYERKPESFFTKKDGFKNSMGITLYKGENGVVPFDNAYLAAYNETANYKKRQILEVRYLDGDGIKSDSFQFRLAASNYYKTRKLTGKKENVSDILKINKTIFEFNHDFLMSIKLYDAKTYLSQIVGNTFGQGNFSFNFSVTRDSEVLNEVIDNIIQKVIETSDTEIDDCYFTFSNDEYDSMIQNALKRRQNADYNTEITNDLMSQIGVIDSGTEAENTKTTISNVLSGVTKSVVDGSSNPKVANSWKFNYDWQFELIRMLVYPLIRPLFTPKVMTIILLNTEIMGNPLELGKKIVTFNDILPYFMNIITNVIKSIKDMIVEMLYSWVIEKLTPLLTIFTLRIVMEQLEAYRKLIEDMLIACIGAYNRLDLNYSGSGIGNGNRLDQVNYADIDPELEKLKQTPVSNTNC